MTATITIFENDYARVWAEAEKLRPDLTCPICGHRFSEREIRKRAEEKLGRDLFDYLRAIVEQKRKWLKIAEKVEAKKVKSFAELKKMIWDARRRPRFPRYEGVVASGESYVIECDGCGEFYHVTVNWRVSEEAFTRPRFNWFKLIRDIEELGDRDAEKLFRRKFRVWFKEYREMALSDLELYDLQKIGNIIHFLADDFKLGLEYVGPSEYPKRTVELPTPLVEKLERYASKHGLTLEKAAVKLLKQGLESEA